MHFILDVWVLSEASKAVGHSKLAPEENAHCFESKVEVLLESSLQISAANLDLVKIFLSSKNL